MNKNQINKHNFEYGIVFFLKEVIIQYVFIITIYVRGASLVYNELKVHSRIAYQHVSDSIQCNSIFLTIYSMVDEEIKVHTSITYQLVSDCHNMLTLKKSKMHI